MKRLKDIPLSVLDLAPVQAGGSVADAFRHSLDLAQHADRWGFQRYWLAEHHGMPGIASAATSVLIGHIAGGTSRIRVGAGGIMLSNHAPLMIAEQFGTLAALYPGRIDLGLGRAPGTNHATMRALRRNLEQNGNEFPEQLDELLSYLDPQHGRRNNGVRAIPGEGETIPIWLLGSSDFSARLAAHLGLPFAFAGQFAPAAMKLALNLFVPSEVLEKPYAMVGVNVFAADTEQEARRLATSHQQMHLNLMRGVPGQMPPPVDSMEGLWLPHEEASVRSSLSASIIGDPPTVEQRLDGFIEETGADELIIHSMIYDHAARVHSYEIVARIAKG
jgi:luciferase family oxidoreductase group 1